RLRPTLRRLRRRRRLHDALALPRQGLSDRLAARRRAPAHGHRAVRPQRHHRPVGPPIRARPRQARMTEPLLETRSLSLNFGALPAPRDVNSGLEPGARHALIGPNGAGKTTLINLLTGVLRPSAGHVLFKGRDITAMQQAARVKLGVARTFQINRLFRGLSVLDNVYIAVAERLGAAPGMIPPAGPRPDVVDEAMALLEALKIFADAQYRIFQLPYRPPPPVPLPI